VGLDGSAGWAWLGGRRDPGNHSNWVWSDGTPWDYRNWALGEPNNPGKQDCSRTWVFGHLSSEQSKWDDYYCNNMQTFVCKKGYSGTVIRNTLIATIDNWGPEYRVAVDIMVHSAGTVNDYGYSSILHCTSSGSDCCNIGARIPAIFYHRSGYFHITSGVNENGNYQVNYNMNLNKWYHIEIVQANKNGKFYYTVNIDGVEIRNVENTNPQSFEDVKVFAGNNFYPASDATYKNLIWESKQSATTTRTTSTTTTTTPNDIPEIVHDNAEIPNDISEIIPNDDLIINEINDLINGFRNG